MTVPETRAATGTRTCPIPGCLNRMASYQVCCKKHWFSIPAEIRNRVWREYRKGAGSPEHLTAVGDALNAAMEATP